MADSQKKYFSVEEMADYIGISVSAGYLLIKTAGFPCLKIGRRYKIPRDRLDDYMNRKADERYNMNDSFVCDPVQELRDRMNKKTAE